VYEVVRVVAEQNLELSHLVVVDAVNDSEPARDTWRRAALATKSPLRFVVLTPPDDTANVAVREDRTLSRCAPN
jgi:predicted kinase